MDDLGALLILILLSVATSSRTNTWHTHMQVCTQIVHTLMGGKRNTHNHAGTVHSGHLCKNHIQKFWTRLICFSGWRFSSVAPWRSISSSTHSSCREVIHVSLLSALLFSFNIEFLQVYLTLSWKHFFCPPAVHLPSIHWELRISLGRTWHGLSLKAGAA